jgi:lipopolysaccharide assembly protein A
MTTPPAAETPPDQQQPTASAAPAAGVPAAGVPAAEVPAARVSAVQPHRIRRTRAGAAWVAAAMFAVVLLLLLIFILENGHTVAISFFGARGHLPLGVALLLAAVLGVLLVAVPGTVRILQLRSTAQRHRGLDVAAAAFQHLPEDVDDAG